MGCNASSISPVDGSMMQNGGSNYDYDNKSQGDFVFSPKMMSADDALLKKVSNSSDQMTIQPADPQAYNSSLLKQRQQAIDNRSYRSTVESWQPKTLQQLGETFKSYANGKSPVDCHWLIYYWITRNISYDTVAYFSGKYDNQTAEDVFRNKKGMCAGYANLYKHLCNKVQLPCEIVGGYSKGYGFEYRKDPPSRTDHAWNVVEIDGHQYLVESTWGSGFLNENNKFEHKLDTYYFFPRPEQMIYHHIPEKPKYQLLQKPISLEDFMKMPHLRPLYFSLNLELISPRNQVHVPLLPGRSYALILLRTPPDVHLMAELKFKDENIENAHYVLFDKRTRLYRCYFAPRNAGQHKIFIYVKKGDSDIGNYDSILDLVLTVKETPKHIVSFPKTWKTFFDLGLEVISPQNTHLIQINGINNTQVLIKVPETVELLGRLTNKNGEIIKNADRTTYDQQNQLWRCEFAPNNDGRFEAMVLAKKKSEPGSYNSAIAFIVDAKQLSTTTAISHPELWPLFHELGLVIIEPKNSSNAVWSENASYAEVLIRAPKDIHLSSQILFNGNNLDNGSFAQYDHDRKLWQLLYAPERTGHHELYVFAQRTKDNSDSGNAVVKFNLEVNKLRHPIKFPFIYGQFQAKKCQLYYPFEGVLKKGSTFEIECYVPGAIDVAVSIDSKPAELGGFSNSIFKKQIKVGSKNVIICAQYSKNGSFDGLVQYSVH